MTTFPIPALPTTARIPGFWLVALLLGYTILVFILYINITVYNINKLADAVTVATFLALVATTLLLPGLLVSALLLPRLLCTGSLTVRWLGTLLVLGVSVALAGCTLMFTLGLPDDDDFLFEPWPCWALGYLASGLLAAAWRLRPWLGPTRLGRQTPGVGR